MLNAGVPGAGGYDALVFGGRGDSLVLRGGPSGFGSINMEIGPGGLLCKGMGATSAGANLSMDGVERVLRSTSSRRYKRDIEDAEVDPAPVLAMEPKTWRDKAEVERDPDTEQRYVGFIAEDLEELGLTEFLTYDAEGRPDAIQYDRLSVALLAVLKDQERRLSRVEGIVR